MERFYQNLLTHDGKASQSPAGALRDATDDELHLAAHYERPYQDSGGRDINLFRRMRYYRAKPTLKLFAHPYYWSGFTFSGECDQAGHPH